MSEYVPYVLKPPLAVILERLELFSRYAALSIMGLIFMLSFSGTLPFVGFGIMGFGVVSAISVTFSRYRWEWVSLPFIMGLSLIAAFLLAPASTGVVIILLLVSCFSMAKRYFHLSQVAKKLRVLPIKE